ncbi:MAG: phosphonopyruvate decarboxylase [Rhodospirillales bacterium]|nr:phosphonopyruvate decarboxylase [Rhodospirillales bacterium]
MIQADEFLQPARARGYDFFTGVPCSFLTPIINRVISDDTLDYVGAASEGEAVAIAAGAWLAGRKTVVMCQNSGLGNTVNPLTSLNFPFRIPTMMIVTWRGEPGLKDEPQHELMGQITGSLLDVMRIPHQPFPQEADQIAAALDAAEGAMDESSLPFAYIMAKGSVAGEKLDQPTPPSRKRGEVSDLTALTNGGERSIRFTLLERLTGLMPTDAAVVATTGFCGRELWTLNDCQQNIYQVGSMGCASGMGLGVALNSDRPVIVIDGDGAALMKLGALATIGAQAPSRLVHVIMDNGAHESTGGQATVSSNVTYAEAAIACGYRNAMVCDTPDGFEAAMKQALNSPGPHMIHARIKTGSIENLGRPTISPIEVAQRFQGFLTGGK